MESVLRHYEHVLPDESIAGTGLERVTAGLINETWFVPAGEATYVLQRLHAIFGPAVNDDIAALTPVLSAAGVPVPRLVATRAGRTFVEVRDGGPSDGIWRLMTRLPGRTVHRIGALGEARAAGATLARFHGALRSLDHTFAFARLGVHDTLAHMRRLDEALHFHASHRLRAAVAPVAEEIAARWSAWGALPALLERIGHGDPKISNFLFLGDGDATEVSGVIDLDTMARTTLDLELGDALRSWCNTQDESGAAPQLDLGIYEAALGAYVSAAAEWLTVPELRAFPASVERICLELSARFAADALNESYFGWDPAVAPTRGDHNLVRARNQLALARDAAAKRDALVELAQRLEASLPCERLATAR